MRVNSQRVSRTILVQSSKVNQAQSSQQERKKVVQAKKAILCRVIHGKSTPLPSYNTSPDNGQRTPQAGNYSPSPKRHLPPGLHVPNKCGLNHNQLNNNSKLPYKFAGLCVTGIVQPTKKMHVHYDEKQGPTVCVQITQQPSVRHITHQVLYAMKSHINMWCIMHCQEDSCPNLQNKGQSRQYTPIIISIQIGGCRISNQMILHYILQGLIPLASAQFLKRSFH